MLEPKSDAGKPIKKQDYLGQIFTSKSLAQRMSKNLLSRNTRNVASILDPCVGPFTFPKALTEAKNPLSSYKLTVVDVDPDMTLSFQNEGHSFSCLHTITADYLLTNFIDKFDLAILNPPYIRQEWIEKKQVYRRLFKEEYGLNIPGTSNLYVYFIIKVIHDLKVGGHFSAIIYDSWQSTRYGQWLIRFLDTFCNSITVEAVPNQPFDGRLIDATILCGTKSLSLNEGRVSNHIAVDWVTERVSPFHNIEGFASIDHLFHTKRGLRLKQANFFLCSSDLIEEVGATPFVKKVGLIDGFTVPTDHPEAVLLLTAEDDNPKLLRELEHRLRKAQDYVTKNESILTWHRERPVSWCHHPQPPYAPILFNYYLRNRPRHIFNPTRFYADNFYGLTPCGDVSVYAWLAILNSTCVCIELLANARSQGYGLAKLQLFEYRRACIPDLNLCSERDIKKLEVLGKSLVEMPQNSTEILQKIDRSLAQIFTDERLQPIYLDDLYQIIDRQTRKPSVE